MANSRPNNSYVELRDAIRRKDKVRARNMILNNVSVNNSRLKCNTPLHWAIIQFEDLEIITMLLDKGANIYAKNYRDLKPLDVAIQNNRTEAAILLINEGALFGTDLNIILIKTIQQNNYIIFKNVIDHGMQYNRLFNYNILFNAAISYGRAEILEHILPHYRPLEASEKYIPRDLVIRTGQQCKECVDLLLRRNFTVKPNSYRDKAFIYGAVENGHLQIVLQLLKLGIDVNLENSKTRFNLLKIACLNKHHEIIENLLEHNVSVNETSTTNIAVFSDVPINSRNSSFFSNNNNNDLCDITCLHIAVLNSDPLMTKLLLRYDAKIIDDPKYFNITCIAVRNNCEEIVRIFLDHGVDVHDVDPEGKTLLHFCVNTDGNDQNSRYNIAKLLLEKGAVDHIQIPDNSLTFEAIANGHRKIAQLFLDYNANIQYVSPDGDTLLHKAIEKDFDIELIKTLLKLNASVHAVNVHMLTPLHIICKHKSYLTADIIQLLLEHNANIEAIDVRGWTPLFYACAAQNDVSVKCLLDHHANTDHTDIDNLTPIYIAAQNCRYSSEAVKVLLGRKVNLHCTDKQGKSVIHVIVENCNTELIKSLVRAQVNLNLVNKDGDTPLHIAIARQSIDMTETLIKYGADINALDKNNRTPLRNVIEYLSEHESVERQEAYWNRRCLSLDSDDDENDYYGSDVKACKEIIKIFKMQIIKLKTAGLAVNKQNLEIIYNPDRDDDDKFFNSGMDSSFSSFQLEVKCEQEIERMKTDSIGFNNMNFYDLLKKNIRYLSRYVKNEKILLTMELGIYAEKYPFYIDIARSRFYDAKLLYNLMNSAKNYFNSNICFQLSDNCVDTVFSYLNMEEIKEFIRVMKLLNE